MFYYATILHMIKTENVLMWNRMHRNILEEKNEKESDYYNYAKEEYQERQEEIEEIMNEYWVYEDEAEEILDNM